MKFDRSYRLGPGGSFEVILFKCHLTIQARNDKITQNKLAVKKTEGNVSEEKSTF